MKNITAFAVLSDGQQAPIETHVLAPDQYPRFFKELVFLHDDAEFVTHGLIRLTMEGSRYFDKDPLELLGGEYQNYDLSNEHHSIQWITVKSGRRNKPHIAGILEWLPVSNQEVLILRLYVLKGLQRRGIGTHLLNEAIRNITDQGYSFLVSAAALEPESSRKFLLSRGFCRIKRGVYKRSLRTSNDIFFQLSSDESKPIVVVND